MPDPQPAAAPVPMRWDTLATGADLWATVVMAAGFVLPAGQSVREHYRIVKTLGQGGMGQVLGVMLVGSSEQQQFALKMVAKPSGPSNDPADQLQAEQQAKAFAALLRGEAAKQELVQRHGVSVARLFALVRFEDGSLGLRMEIARGHSLESFLDDEAKQRSDSPPDLNYCLVVMRKVLYQLRRLHELVDPSSPSGFVHSDMKPGNVFVDDGDRYDPLVTLLDFGVATAGHALDIDRSRASGRKSLILHDAGGTFGFAPPHHFTGKPSPLSDVYAALVILYEMIALQTPWDFTGIPKTAANLFKLEDAMRKGPRPVGTGRASIPANEAAALDAFFAEEFRRLQQLADEAHVARNAPDDDIRRAMAERLRTLAHSYQDKLDALRQQLTGGATRTSDPAATPAPNEIDQRIRARNMPTRVDRPNSEPTASTLAANDEPVRVPYRPLFGFGSFLILIAAAVAGSWVYLHGVPRELTRAISGGGQESAPQPVAEPAADASPIAAPTAIVDASVQPTVAAVVPDVVTVVPDAGLLAAEQPDVAIAPDVFAAAMATDAMVMIDAGAIAQQASADASVLPTNLVVETPEATTDAEAATDAALSVPVEATTPLPVRTNVPPTSRVATPTSATRPATSSAHAPVTRAQIRTAAPHTTTSHAAAHSRTPAHRTTSATTRTHRPVTTHRTPARTTPRRPTRSTRRH